MSSRMGPCIGSYMQASTKQAVIITNPRGIVYKVSGFESIIFAFPNRIRVKNGEDGTQAHFLTPIVSHNHCTDPFFMSHPLYKIWIWINTTKGKQSKIGMPDAEVGGNNNADLFAVCLVTLWLCSLYSLCFSLCVVFRSDLSMFWSEVHNGSGYELSWHDCCIKCMNGDYHTSTMHEVLVSTSTHFSYSARSLQSCIIRALYVAHKTGWATLDF